VRVDNLPPSEFFGPNVAKPRPDYCRHLPVTNCLVKK
jgi:hypothetical protein